MPRSSYLNLAASLNVRKREFEDESRSNLLAMHCRPDLSIAASLLFTSESVPGPCPGVHSNQSSEEIAT